MNMKGLSFGLAGLLVAGLFLAGCAPKKAAPAPSTSESAPVVAETVQAPREPEVQPDAAEPAPVSANATTTVSTPAVEPVPTPAVDAATDEPDSVGSSPETSPDPATQPTATPKAVNETDFALILPAGFRIALFTPEPIGPIRFMAFSPDGILFVSLPNRSGLYSGNRSGGTIYALPDRDRDGKGDSDASCGSHEYNTVTLSEAKGLVSS